MASFTFEALTPAAFLTRSAQVFADREAVVEGAARFTYSEFHHRCAALAGVLHRDYRVGAGDRVGALCLNSHVMLELHNAVPFCGAALVPLNVRLTEGELHYILDHSGAKLLVATSEMRELATRVAGLAGIPLLVGGGVGDDYEVALRSAEPYVVHPSDEREVLGISYTSGTTGRPKGVTYHRRGAYLQSLAIAYHTALNADSSYLWTLPMFHCHGWCFTWAVTAAGARHVVLPKVDAVQVWDRIDAEGITHLSAAPTVLRAICEAARASGRRSSRPIHVQTGGSPPSPGLLAALADLGFETTHLYGLTETYGPVAINVWQSKWDRPEIDDEERQRLRARQGVGNVLSLPLRVVDGTGHDVRADATEVGEVVCRGNNVMLGYWQDDDATEDATLGGWFRTGDLAVMHPDGYVEITDRAKDIIISGGENIASVEIERALEEHPLVLESAVVARPDEKWGEVPVAFVVYRADEHVPSDADINAFLSTRLARFKLPKEVVRVAQLPKTSTGKIEKARLRSLAAGREVNATNESAAPRRTRRVTK
jgi:fatty-acyl-CoA synthase